MYKTGPERLILIGYLLQGVLCQKWSARMPSRIKALDGQCVVIPCSFTVKAEYESSLTASCKGIWKDNWRNVFDSSLAGTASNPFSGNLTGNLQHKECTTVLNDFTYDYFNFRLDCDTVKMNFPEYVLIEINDHPSTPTLSPVTVEVMEGTSVSLTCSAATPCPTSPPSLTWTPNLIDSRQDLLESQNQTLTSVLTFTASPVHNRMRITCTALYKRQRGLSAQSSQISRAVTVFYSPRNTSVSVSPSLSVLRDKVVTLTCSSSANPNIWRYRWYRVNGEQATQVRNGHVLTVQSYKLYFPDAPVNTTVSVSPSGPAVEGDTVIMTCRSIANPAVQNYTWVRTEATGDGVPVGSGERLILDGKASDSGGYYCVALHVLGMEKARVVQLDIQYPPRNTSVSVTPTGSVTEGSSVTLICSSDANPAVKNYTCTTVKPRTHMDCTPPPSSASMSHVCTVASEILNSRCIRIAATSQIQCFCECRGNPTPTLVWRLVGEAVNHSSNTVIREEPMGILGLRSSITIRQSQEDEIPTLVCLSSNSGGSDIFSFNLTSLETYEGFRAYSLSIGTSLAAGIIMLLCIPLLLVCKRSRAQPPVRGQGETSELIVTDRTVSQDEENIYANNVMQNEALGSEETTDGNVEHTDLLHYADLNFPMLQAGVDAADGEIRGVSMTTDYAMIRLHSADGTGNETGEVKSSSKAPLGENEQYGPVETAVDEATRLSEEKAASIESAVVGDVVAEAIVGGVVAAAIVSVVVAAAIVSVVVAAAIVSVVVAAAIVSVVVAAAIVSVVVAAAIVSVVVAAAIVSVVVAAAIGSVVVAAAIGSVVAAAIVSVVVAAAIVSVVVAAAIVSASWRRPS
ncbi:hypothetical protein DPEC_G00351210 [Dallia pectoralis]|uniref:Uncharacterized protein n=1 Tax=Dallia pectoralis TaxID=75939 RepID=A0ACC2F245_DALPE|nr:hypothetical protein DPEC_G00351210 [Dallia pectoralis]